MILCSMRAVGVFVDSGGLSPGQFPLGLALPDGVTEDIHQSYCSCFKLQQNTANPITV